MKKYVKPELFYEHYELSQHIADCQWELVHAENECKAYGDGDYSEVAGLVLFTDGLGCDVTPETFGDYCYHGSADGTRTFMS